MILDDGSVIPSFMEVSQPDAAEQGRSFMFDNTSLRVGYLTAIHYPGDTGYTKLKRIVYDAIVPHGDGTGAESFIPYYNVKPISMFGSKADSEHHTFRCPRSFSGNINDDFQRSTTKVLLLCANGRTNTAYIIAADDNIATPSHTQKDGHNWGWTFNGINQKIDKEGQFSLTYNGATAGEDNENLEKNEEVAGSTFQFQKDGSILLDDVKGDSIKIDKENKKITIIAGSMEQTTTDGGWTVECAGDVKVHADKNVIIQSDGKTCIGSEGASQSLVLGQELATALADLVSAFTSAPMVGMMGKTPVTLSPPVQAKLAQWIAKYTSAGSPFLAKDKFTE